MVAIVLGHHELVRMFGVLSSEMNKVREKERLTKEDIIIITVLSIVHAT